MPLGQRGVGCLRDETRSRLTATCSVLATTLTVEPATWYHPLIDLTGVAVQDTQIAKAVYEAIRRE